MLTGTLQVSLKDWPHTWGILPVPWAPLLRGKQSVSTGAPEACHLGFETIMRKGLVLPCGGERDPLAAGQCPWGEISGRPI